MILSILITCLMDNIWILQGHFLFVKDLDGSYK